jgi:hypothetical protein
MGARMRGRVFGICARRLNVPVHVCIRAHEPMYVRVCMNAGRQAFMHAWHISSHIHAHTGDIASARIAMRECMDAIMAMRVCVFKRV